MSSLEQLLANLKVIAVVCDQWGDTGKGKYSDYFSNCWADVIARGTGGNNAGHTVVVNGKKRIFHLLPAGIAYDNEGKVNVLGNGMVIDVEALCGELDELDAEGMSYNHLMISEDAHVIMPYHVEYDKRKNASQAKGGIGSTGRGVGPCYTDKIARRGIAIRDLFDKDELSRKIEKALAFYPDASMNKTQIIEELDPYTRRIKGFVRDTVSEMHSFVRLGKKVLLEGAQGLLLSADYGTYPYVTSSDPSINGTAAGVGLSAHAVDLTLGIVKFPFMTRVGGGPFPTELGGEKSEKYCAPGLKRDIRYELKNYGIPHNRIPRKGENDAVTYDHKHPSVTALMNSDDPFLQGVGIRLAGEEYGASTGRPRRAGWTDLVALKYAVGINGPNIILTKADVLQGANEIKLATGYNLDGISHDRFSRDSRILYKCKPEYRSFPGFNEDISQVSSFGDLPEGLRSSIDFLEKHTGGRVRIVSTGRDRSETIIKE